MLSERLEIRRFKQTDLKDIHEYLSKENIVHFEPYSPLSLEKCQKSLNNWIDSKDFWAVCLKKK